MRVRRTLVLAFLAVFLAVGLSAQSTVSSGQMATVVKDAPAYGTSDWTAVRLNAFDFTTLTGAPYAWTGGVSRYSTVGPLNANFHVPTGAIIRRLEFDYCDSNPTNHMTMAIIGCDNQGQNCGFLAPLLTSLGDGCTYVSDSSLSIPVDNYNHIYNLEVQFGATDGTNTLGGAIVSYELQVSPAPGTATFGDVPTSHPFFQYIEALAASGITGGCSAAPPLYCPDNPLTRGQMAVFLSKALGLHFPE